MACLNHAHCYLQMSVLGFSLYIVCDVWYEHPPFFPARAAEIITGFVAIDNH